MVIEEMLLRQSAVVISHLLLQHHSYYCWPRGWAFFPSVAKGARTSAKNKNKLNENDWRDVRHRFRLLFVTGRTWDYKVAEKLYFVAEVCM